MSFLSFHCQNDFFIIDNNNDEHDQFNNFFYKIRKMKHVKVFENTKTQ